jgi:type I restriction enzyme S subunit
VNEENELPRGWVWTKVGEVAETTSGGTPSRNHPEYYNGAIPWVKSGELEDTVIYDVEEFITEEGLKNSSAKVFQRGTVLVAMYGATVGKTGILGLDATTNQAICAIFPLMNAFTSKFIAYWLQSQRHILVDQSFGGAQPNINQGIIRSFPLPLPPLPEQQRIVDALEQQFSRLDAGVAALRQAKARLKRYRAAVLKAAVEGKLTEEWRAEHPTTEPASKLLERILAERRAKWEADLRAKGNDPSKVKYAEPAKPDVESLPELPEGWCWARAEQLCDFITKGTTPSAEKLFSGGGEIPFIKVYNLTDHGFLNFSINPTFISKKTHLQELARSKVIPGDVLLNIVGPPLGKVSIVPDLFQEWNINQAIAVFRPMPSYDRFFLCFSLLTEHILSWAKLRAKATAGQFNLTLEICRDLPLPVPPLMEQQQIVAEVERRLSLVNQLEATIEANLKRAERLRQSILKEAFAGRLVLQDPNDEPASVLLERIRKERNGRKQGMVNNGRAVNVAVREPERIDVKEVKEVGLWEGVGG